MNPTTYVESKCRTINGRPQPHTFKQWSNLFDRCIWCGVFVRRAPLVADVQPVPRVKTREATSEERALVSRAFGESVPPRVPNAMIETVFKSMAREYAAHSELLQQWKRAGNKMPRVYE